METSSRPVPETPARDHALVVVGGGFAGLALVKAVKAPNLSITILDQRNHHLFQPLLYQVATTILPTSDVAWPIRHLVRRRCDVTTVLGEVVSIDKVKRCVTLRGELDIPYDTLVLATGARHSYFGHDDWERAAPGLKSLEDATTIRRRVLTAFEEAELSQDPDEREALLTFVVVGGGPTGVELAGIIAELAQEILPGEFRNIDTRQTRVLLVEAGPRVLPAFPPRLSAYAEEALTRLGVTVVTGESVSAISSHEVSIGERRVGARTTIWAAGVKASPAAVWLHAEADRNGRVKVEPDLSIPGHPEIFAIGDTACVTLHDGKQVPGLAPAAKQQGQFVARVIMARLSGRTPERQFSYRHLGNLATVGKRSAVVDFGRLQLKGVLAWWLWGLAHIYFLIETRSRVAVALSWLWSYFTGRNSARLITQKDVHADN
ncbi:MULTISPECIES: NAD(P)/FAD-dependent oxidoreductase [unclassified Chelatococcus]|uniref:NAD(P)/FAD-dependent oxidoreductase n=1 Tax=unclassified Chelatococcus TaxID=2638111 RepID=UPI001BCDB0BA|nr:MULTISPECIES: NAD(P)/FAD-dependent oxidoreductase [unclassified Chelatococcus]MBS7700058.1 NAD(P)/FAD-dependent oxidoreductase [Chelatococcus sp. YT9]MBX3556751.1 NAD(P)/FAD-dependent oxidoreductase [Chelatococcus sp.]